MTPKDQPVTAANGNEPITTIIFDVDDTLYDVGTGFTAHRNGYGAQKFMVDKLHFPDMETARVLRDEYFERYHATAKALKVAESEGKFPPLPEEILQQYKDRGEEPPNPRFHPKDLAEFWASNLNFEILGGEKTDMKKDLEDCPLHLVAFSNGPRKYVKRCLTELGLFDIFGEKRLFAVDDVLPHCKPEPESFQIILDSIGVASPSQCVMVEDSMKNIRVAKSLGMKTVLIAGAKNVDATAAAESEATKPGDAPKEDDPAVDVSIETVEELRTVLPGLWEKDATFVPMNAK